MAPTFTFESLATDLGTSTGDGLRNVANTAANFVCNAYQNYAEATTGFSDPTGIGKFNNALFSRLCSPRGQTPPTPPTPPYSGGQCPKLYTVAITYKYGSSPPITNTRTFVNVLGPLGSLSTKPTGPPNINYVFTCQPNSSHPDGTLSLENGAPTTLTDFALVSVIPTPNSGADDCGNPPSSYPPVIPPPGVTNNTTNVNVGAGVIINAPISIIPTVFDVNASLNPQIDVNVGPFNVTFDAGGVTIAPSFNFGTGSKTTPNPSLNPNNTNTPASPSPGTAPCDCDDIRRKLQVIDTRTQLIKTDTSTTVDNVVPVHYTFASQVIASGQGGIVALPANCVEVLVDLTKQPANAKIQEGGGDFPPCYFCGYYSFGEGTHQNERVPLNISQSVFYPPRFATSFGWNLYTGYEANITAVIAIPDKSDSEFGDRQMKKKAV